MTERTIPNDLIGRVLTDSDFRSELVKDPAGTLKKSGYDVDPATLAAITDMDAAQLEDAISDFTAAIKSGRGPE